MQTYKSVYFPDHPEPDTRRRHLRLAFGRKEADLYQLICGMSSSDLRDLLGLPWSGLVSESERHNVSLNKFCLSRLQRVALQLRASEQPALPGYGVDWRLATYAGGHGEPLHEWYPYLESYSPRFVEYVLAELTPLARSVLDPFSGSGATPLTVARKGLESWYCELNPLLQFLTEVKASVLSLPMKQRTATAESLRGFLRRLPDLIFAAQADPELRSTYAASFGESVFFDERTFEQVLSARTVVDEFSCQDRLTGSLAAVAILSALVPASLLQRAGDLRYKTPNELARKKTPFLSAIQSGLTRISDDLVRLKPITRIPILLCGDSRYLDRVPPRGIDAVVTSPPYLNGTNYVRNTKVELWFLRALKSSADLASLRLQTVTAGICDVSKAKVPRESHPSVAKVVSKLVPRAYDSRIPEMVAAYFADLTVIFRALQTHLNPGARLVIDIGDSVYAGTHVSTDELLRECLVDIGYSHLATTVIRKRRSRGGMALRQVLLLFQHGGGRHSLPVPALPIAWSQFKTELPHQKRPFSQRNWGHPLHSLCSFQGKLKPAIARFLVEAFVPPSGTVLDPFGGVGTIPFEAVLSGRRAFGFEISPAAHVIGFAKLKRPDPKRCITIIRGLDDFLRTEKVTDQERSEAAGICFNKPLSTYFHPRTLDEVMLARRLFAHRLIHDASEALVFACLLHILHGNRPYALSRRSHPITPFAPTGRSEYRPLIPRLQDKVSRSLEVPLPMNFTAGEAYLQDATGTWPESVRDLDAVITSPPFYDSTRFYLANWMRLWMTGWSRKDFDVRPQGFIDERQKKDFAVYKPVFRQARERLRRGGVFVMHLGRSWKCDMSARLAEVARPWFRVVDRFNESVAHCESHGIRDKGTVGQHQYLVLG